MGIALCGVEKIHENVDVPIFVDISRNNHIWTDGMRGMASAMLKERQCIVCLPAQDIALFVFSKNKTV